MKFPGRLKRLNLMKHYLMRRKICAIHRNVPYCVAESATAVTPQDLQKLYSIGIRVITCHNVELCFIPVVMKVAHCVGLAIWASPEKYLTILPN